MSEEKKYGVCMIITLISVSVAVLLATQLLQVVFIAIATISAFITGLYEVMRREWVKE